MRYTEEQMIRILGQDAYDDIQKQTERAYLQGMEEFKAAQTANPSREFNMYEDGKLVQQLLKDGYAPEVIKQVIAINSPVANLPGKVPLGYATSVVSKSELVLQRLNEAKNWTDKGPEHQRQNLVYEGDVLKNEYMLFLKQHVNDPGSKLKTSTDIEIAAKLLRKSHEGENAIARIIKENSPIAQEAGRNPDRYVQFVMAQTMERQNRYEQRLKNIDANYDKAAAEYIRQAEGIQSANPDRGFTAFQDGRIAVEMLRNDYEKENIQRAITEISPAAAKLQTEKGLEPAKYAQSVVYHATEEIKRQAELSSAPAPEGKNLSEYLQENLNGNSASAAYLYTLKHYTEQYPEAKLNAFTDTHIAKSMLSNYSREEVQKAIIEKSPVSIQPGRFTQRYAENIVYQASEQLDRQIGIQTEKRLDQEIKKGISNSTHLDYCKRAKEEIVAANGKWQGQSTDVKIAQDLLLQGKKRLEVSQAIKTYSPEVIGKSAKEALKYTQNAVKQALTPDVAKQIKNLSKGIER